MPIFSAIGAAFTSLIGGVASFFAGGGLLAKVALAGLSIAAQYAIGKFLGPKPQAQASQLETAYGENLVRSIILGKVGTAGHHVYRNAYGDGNRRVQDVYVLSHFRVNGITRVRFEGEWRTLGGTVDAARGQRIQGISAQVWVKLYTGAMDQAADAELIARSNPSGRWTSDHRGAGIAYAIVTSILDQEHLPQPWQPFFEVEGAPLYDWRRDTTAGGSGSHRWNDQSTWEYANGIGTNPVLMMYALERGFLNGTEMMVGKGVSVSSLPLANWTVAANICDEFVGEGRRYRASCIVSSGEGVTHDANMSPLLEACAGSWLQLVGEEYPIVGAVQAVVTTFTDDDLILDAPLRFSAKRPRTELVNTVAGSYVDPTNFYQSSAFATRVDTGAEAEDRERLAVSISYSAVTEPACVDRLADIAIRASRFQASGEVVLRPKFMGLKPGQWVTWNSALYGSRTFQVLSKQLGALGPNGARNVSLSLQQVGAGIFDPTAYETVPPTIIRLDDPVFQQEVANFIVAPVTVADNASGAQFPGLRMSWDAIEDGTVVGVEIQYRPQFQTTAVFEKRVPADQTVVTVQEGLVSSTIYEVRTRLVADPPRTIPWTAWREVTTPAAPLTDVAITLAKAQDDLRNLWRGLARNIADFRAIAERIAADTAVGQGAQVQQLSAVAKRGNATAVALAQFRAEVDEEFMAFAEALIGVEASVNDSLASGLFRITAVAGEGDVVVRGVVQMRASIADEWVEAGQLWEAGFIGGDPEQKFANVVVFANSFKVVGPDGSSEAYPLIFEGGELKLQVARIGTAIVETLQTATGKTVMGALGPGIEGFSVKQ